MVKADTIEELAQKLGLPVEDFKATVERYNELYQIDTPYHSLFVRKGQERKRKQNVNCANGQILPFVPFFSVILYRYSTWSL